MLLRRERNKLWSASFCAESSFALYSYDYRRESQPYPRISGRGGILSPVSGAGPASRGHKGRLAGASKYVVRCKDTG